jgi:hypothetical protein
MRHALTRWEPVKWESGMMEGYLAVIDLDAVITCPQCGFTKPEQMPPNT